MTLMVLMGISAEQGGKTTSLYLLVILCLVQPRMLLIFSAGRTNAGCWIIFNLQFPFAPQDFPKLQNCFQLAAPRVSCCLGLILSQHFSLLYCMRFLSDTAPHLSWSLRMAAQPSGESAITPSCVSLMNLFQVHSIFVQITTVEQDWTHYSPMS